MTTALNGVSIMASTSTSNHRSRPGPIRIHDNGDVSPINSASTIGTPPIKFTESGESGERVAQELAIACQGLPEREINMPPFMFENPGVLCYRNAAIVLLMSLDPFLGWLRLYKERMRQHESKIPLVGIRLLDVAEAYWAPRGVRPGREDLGAGSKLIRRFWTVFEKSGLIQRGRHDDPSFFLMILFQMLERELGDEDEENIRRFMNPLLRDVLDSIFQVWTVRNQVGCECCNFVRKREPVVSPSGASWPTHLILTLPGRNDLIRRIQSYLYGGVSGIPTCPICNRFLGPEPELHTFRKIHSLPEILLLNIGYPSKPDNTDKEIRVAVDTSAKLQIPEVLDLRKFMESSAASENARYRLIGAICHRGNGRVGHYIAHIRGQNGEWHRLDDSPGRGKEKVTGSSFLQLLREVSARPERRSFRPAVLAFQKMPAGRRTVDIPGTKYTSEPLPDDEARSKYVALSIEELHALCKNKDIPFMATFEASELIDLLIEDDKIPPTYEAKSANWLTKELKSRGISARGAGTKAAKAKLLREIYQKKQLPKPPQELKIPQQAPRQNQSGENAPNGDEPGPPSGSNGGELVGETPRVTVSLEILAKPGQDLSIPALTHSFEFPPKIKYSADQSLNMMATVKLKPQKTKDGSQLSEPWDRKMFHLGPMEERRSFSPVRSRKRKASGDQYKTEKRPKSEPSSTRVRKTTPPVQDKTLPTSPKGKTTTKSRRVTKRPSRLCSKPS